MNHFYKHLLFLFFVGLIFTESVSITAQTNVHMISDMRGGNSLFTQILPGGDIRVFGRTEEHHFWGEGYAAFVDVHANQDFNQLQVVTYPFLMSESFYIPLEDGSMIAGYNQFECDFIMESVVVRYDAQGDTLWSRMTRENYSTIQRMVLVDTEVIGVIRTEDTLYYNLKGDQMFISPSLFYDVVLPHDTGFIAGIDNRLVLLDGSFNVIREKNLSSQIYDFNFIKDGIMLVRTEGAIYVLNDQLEEIGWDPALHEGYAVVASDNYYWELHSDQVVKLDLFFEPIESFPIDENVQLQTGYGQDGKLTMIGIYWSGFPVIFQGGEEEISFMLSPDIGVSSIFVTDTVFMMATPHGAFMTNDFSFPEVNVGVTNFSGDTIRSFTIFYDEYTECDNCHRFRHEWQVDSLIILPFSQVSVILDSFQLTCSGIDSSLCLRAILENQEPDAERNNDSYCTEFEITTGIDHSGIVENHLIHPVFPDLYQSYQLLPNGDMRVFVISAMGFNQELRIPSFMDISSDAILEELVPNEIEDEFYWNGSPELHVLALKDGSSIISSTFNGCDVVPPTGVMKLSESGQREWRIELPDFLSPIVKMVFVDSNMILLDFFQGDDVLFDRDGNVLPINAPDTSYHITVETNSGFIASFQDRLDILSHGFDVIMSYPLPGFITEIRPLRDEAYLILSGNSYIIFDKFNQLSNPGLEYYQNDLLWESENYYWQYVDESRLLIKYGPTFTPIDTSVVPPGIVPRVGISFSDTLIVIAAYNHPLSEGLVVYRGHEEPFNLRLSLDLGITNIEIPDPILVEYIGSGSFEQGWIHHYSFIDVEIENFGMDTVHKYLIQNHERSFCFFCTNYSHIWSIDSLPIAPGEKVTVSLGPFEPHCFQQEPGNICLSVHAPDDKADSNYLNDDFCKPFSILIGTNDVNDPFPITIRPNPTSDRTFIDQEKDEPLSVFIINSTGMTLDQLRIESSSTEISMAEYQSGLYYLQIENANGQVVMKKIVVLR